MASPQLESGFFRISNDLMNAVLRYPFNLYEMRVFMAIIRETYGWNRKESRISYGMVARMTGIDRRHVMRTFKTLKAKNLILIRIGTDQKSQNLTINKDFEQWNWKDVDMFGDNFRPDASTGDTPDASTGDTPDASTGDIGVALLGDTSKTPKTLKDKSHENGSALPNGNQNPKDKEKIQKLSKIVKGLDSYITGPDPRPLITHLAKEGYDISRSWGAVVQSRQKSNPTGYFVTILADPKYAVSDSAMEQAKKEMRKYEF